MSMKNSPTADTRCRWVSPRNRWCDRIVASGYEPWLHGGRAEARKISGPARATRIHVPGYQPPVYYNSRSYCKSSRRSRRTWWRTRRGWPWRRRTRRRRQRPLLHLVRHALWEIWAAGASRWWLLCSGTFSCGCPSGGYWGPCSQYGTL